MVCDASTKNYSKNISTCAELQIVIPPAGPQVIREMFMKIFLGRKTNRLPIMNLRGSRRDFLDGKNTWFMSCLSISLAEKYLLLLLMLCVYFPSSTICRRKAENGKVQNENELEHDCARIHNKFSLAPTSTRTHSTPGRNTQQSAENENPKVNKNAALKAKILWKLSIFDAMRYFQLFLRSEHKFTFSFVSERF